MEQKDNLSELIINLKQLKTKELNILCDEIRHFLVDYVSKTGGHLASNLGVVELTVAIHRVFDFPEDKIVFDVGHQAYVHKILTGRMDQFDTLRKYGGLSGFPKRSESIYDSFDTGHSSTSVSAALGMARARDLSGEKNNIIALFGDGALTGGEIFEALNDAGHKKTPLVLILNDNAMSISKNVGAMSKHLRNLRMNRFYFKSKRKLSNALDRTYVGKFVKGYIEKIKRSVRIRILPTTMFDELGFKYIGPVDGHNVESLITCLEYAKEQHKPVLIHVRTIKGNGYLPAEKNPSSFHGVGAFDAHTGKVISGSVSYSSKFGETLCEIAEYNEKVVGITCAMPDGTGMSSFAHKFKERFYDVGIAEQHGVTFAAGMAASGFVPVIALYSTFLQRAYDQVLHDVCLQNLHVVFPIDRAGIVGADGETHQGVYDISFLNSMPNMTLLSPSSFASLNAMLSYAINVHDGPIAIRYPRGNAQAEELNRTFEINNTYTRHSGSDITIFATGRMVLKAEEVYKNLTQAGISCEVVEITTLIPLNKTDIILSAKKTNCVVTIEDNIESGGMGEHIADILLSNGVKCDFKVFAFPSVPIVHGTVEQIDKHYGLDSENITNEIMKMIDNKRN